MSLNIFNQDALNFLAKLENESIDLIYCDLPFGTTQCNWDEVIPFDKMWEQVNRVAKQNTPIVFHAQNPFTSALIMSNPKMFKYTWVWEKSKATGFLNAKKRPLVAHEDIVVFCKGTPVYYPQMTEGTAYNKGVRKQQTENDVYGSFEQVEVKSSGLRYPRSVQYFKTAESEGKTWHKTQKPKELCKYIIETYSKKDDFVLDFTAGSGTTAIGSEIGRNVILVEKNYSEFQKIRERWGEKIDNKIFQLWKNNSLNYLSVNDKVMMKDGRILTVKSLGYNDFISIEEVGYVLKKDISTIL